MGGDATIQRRIRLGCTELRPFTASGGLDTAAGGLLDQREEGARD